MNTRKRSQQPARQRQLIQARPWQVDAINVGKDARFFLCQAPGGSGKSALQCMLGCIDQAADPGQKQLILVPQQHIHKTFFGEGHEVGFEFTPGSTAAWQVTCNLCDGPRAGRGDRLRQFLLADPASLGGRPTAISTHLALVGVWQRLSRAEKRRAVRNTTFRLDEAHHVSGAFTDADLGLLPRGQQARLLEEATKLGDFCRYVINADDPTCKLHFTTATFFRGDRRAILSETVKEQFVNYYLAWEEYFPSLGIEELFFDYHDYQDDPLPALLDLIRAEKDHRHLVILPPLNRKFRNPLTLDRLLKALEGVFPRAHVLDLVSRKTQRENKRRLLADPEAFRIVVACRLFNEGTDWVVCDRLHNTDACERSLTLAVQRFFRPLRQHPGKKTVTINNYIPAFDPAAGKDERREVLSDRFNAFLTSIITNGELLPVVVPSPRESLGENARPRRLPLQELYGAETFHEVVKALFKGYEGIPNKEDAGCLDRLAGRVIEKFGAPEGVRQEDLKAALLEQLLRIANPALHRVTRADLHVAGFDATAIKAQGFDKIWEKQGRHASVLFYGSENVTGAMLRELLNIVCNPLTLEAVHAGIKAHYQNTGERLTGYSGYIPELEITARALQARLKRHYQTTITKEVNKVLGTAEDMRQNGLLAKTHGLIRQYHQKGVRLTKHHGMLPELGITCVGLQHRLEKLGTTLAAEVDTVLGPDGVGEIPLAAVHEVIREYARRGVRLKKHFGPIAELGGIKGPALDGRLKRKFKTTLAKEVRAVLGP